MAFSIIFQIKHTDFNCVCVEYVIKDLFEN